MNSIVQQVFNTKEIIEGQRVTVSHRHAKGSFPGAAERPPHTPQVGPPAKIPVAAARNIGACLLQYVHHVHCAY